MKISMVYYQGGFNYSAINMNYGARHAKRRGKYLLLLNNDTEELSVPSGSVRW